MKIDRNKLLYDLEKEDFMDLLHRQIKEGLVGTLRNEYLMKKPMREPYEKWNDEANQLISLPIFHALVDMMTSNILHSTGEKFINLICDVLEKEFST